MRVLYVMASSKEERGVRILNCGCFTEYCSAVAEDEDGSFRLVNVDDILDSK